MPNGGESPAVLGYAPNVKTFRAGRLDLTTIAVQFPDIQIPDDFEILVKAGPGNPVGSLVYIAPSAAEVNDLYSCFYLAPNDPVTYRIQNAKEIYAAASLAAGCYVLWTVEQRRK